MEDTLMSMDIYGRCTDKEFNDIEALYEIYRQIGGYPEVIKTYLRTKDVKECMKTVSSIVNQFTMESNKYFSTEREVLILASVYDNIIIQMCNSRKGSGNKVVDEIKTIAEGSQHQRLMITNKEILNTMSWLMMCGVITPCDMLVDGNITLDIRKFYYSDCGITNFIGQKANMDSSNLQGFLTETFVCNELDKLYKEPENIKVISGDRHCSSIHGDYELDFIAVTYDEERIKYGIEVKTNKGDPKSLKVYIKDKLVDKGIVVKPSKGGEAEQFDTIPIFTVGCRFPYYKNKRHKD